MKGSGETARGKMADVVQFLVAARCCADLMLEGAAFIRKELPNVHMSEALRVRTQQLCEDLVGTKHDVVSELLDFYDPIDGRSQDEVTLMRVKRINAWLIEYLPGMHEIVQALDAATQTGVNDKGAYILVAETAAGILNAYKDVREAAERIVSIPSAQGPST
jgi:hypothetical protein